MVVMVPPEIVFPAQALLQRAGADPTEEQVLDLLVGVGLDVLRTNPKLVFEGLDPVLLSGPFFEAVGLRFPATKSASPGRLRAELTQVFGRQISLSGAVRLAAAAGALSLGLPIDLARP